MKVILIFGFVPAGYVGLLVGLELAGVNFMWHSARDLILLLFWSVFLFGIAGAVIASVLTALGWWRNLSADKLVFLILTVLATVFIFIDRFGWCYPCHQFLDKRAPHLIHTPARSFMLTVALAVGCVAAGALIGGVTYVIAKTWNARKVRIGVYGAAIGVVAVATIISILSTPDLGVNRHAQGEAGTVTREPGARRVLIIIDDGLTWDIINPLMADGRMPAYRHLVRSGTRAHLGTLYPTVSPPIWTTMATGHTPERHGVGGFINYAYPGMKNGISAFPCPTRMMLPQTFIKIHSMGFGSSRPLGPSHRKVRAIWNIAGEMGIDVGIVGWRYTWPVEKVNGFMVSNRLFRKRPEKHVYPPELTKYVNDVARKARKTDLESFVSCDPESLLVEPKASSRVELITYFMDGDYKYQAVADSLFNLLDPTLMAIGFTSVDALEHLFYYEHSLLHESEECSMSRYLSRFTSEDLVGCLGNVIINAYVHHDSLIQRWIDWLGEDDVLIIASDHGHKMNGNAHHYPEPGVLVLYGEPFREGLNLSNATVYDIVPTALYLLGLPVAEDMPGSVLEDAIKGAWLDEHPIRTVETYETSELEAQEAPPEVDDELLRKLKALGYIR